MESRSPSRLRPIQAAAAGAALALLVGAAACSSPVRLAGPASPTPGGSTASANQPSASPTGSGGAGIVVAPAPSPGAGSTTPSLAQLQAEYRAVVEKVIPSIVRIDTDQGLGSGIVMDTSGDIVTNAHVIEGASQITVTTSDGVTHPATKVGTAAGNDLAVIKIQAGDGALKPAVFGDSSQLHLGDIVLAIGSPLGLTDSVTEGIVSGLGRSQPEGNGVTLTNLVQTSASINPGNSGGALVNIDGQVIGIPTLGASSGNRAGGNADGVGFAIPSSQAVNIANQLITGGTVTHTGLAYMGITSGDSAGGGASINSVIAGGPSDKAGIKATWVITALGSRAVPDSATVSQVLATHKPGDQLEVGLRLPDGSRKTVTVTLGERPVNP